MKIQTYIFYTVITVSAVLSACSPESKPSPFFPDADLIDLKATEIQRTGYFTYQLPNSRCEYVMVGLTAGKPVVDNENHLTNLAWGSRTNLKNALGVDLFTPENQSWDKLYKFDSAPGTEGDFDPLSPIDLNTLNDADDKDKGWYLLVWAYDSNYNLIASSPEVQTNK